MQWDMEEQTEVDKNFIGSMMCENNVASAV